MMIVAGRQGRGGGPFGRRGTPVKSEEGCNNRLNGNPKFHFKYGLCMYVYVRGCRGILFTTSWLSPITLRSVIFHTLHSIGYHYAP